jgi:uncharacterized protein with FMN-binding domain
VRRARGAILSLASVIGFVAVLVGHLMSGSPSTTAAGSTKNSSRNNQPSSGPPASTTPKISNKSGTATGKAANYGYGEIAVTVTLQNGRIVSSKVTRLLTAESYSQQLAQAAIPILTREVLSVQSAHIAAVSGATYTSEGYAYSLQSALDTLATR